jgi:hypothetical protein
VGNGVMGLPSMGYGVTRSLGTRVAVAAMSEAEKSLTTSAHCLELEDFGRRHSGECLNGDGKWIGIASAREVSAIEAVGSRRLLRPGSPCCMSTTRSDSSLK